MRNGVIDRRAGTLFCTAGEMVRVAKYGSGSRMGNAAVRCHSNPPDRAGEEGREISIFVLLLINSRAGQGGNWVQRSMPGGGTSC